MITLYYLHIHITGAPSALLMHYYTDKQTANNGYSAAVALVDSLNADVPLWAGCRWYCVMDTIIDGAVSYTASHPTNNLPIR